MTADLEGSGLSQDGAVDVWQLGGLPGRLMEASYLTADTAATQYRLIVDVLLEQQERSLTGVGLDELEELVQERLATEVGRTAGERLFAGLDLVGRMRQLKAWDVVIAWDDRSLRPDNFLRNATRYQLTATAAQLHRAVRQLGIDEAASLAATLAPPVIVAQLTLLTDWLTSDPQRAAEAWSVIRATLDGMSRAAQSWQATLADAMAGAPDAAKVSRLADALQLYVTTWGAGIDTHSEQIAGLADDLRRRDDSAWRPVAMASLGPEARDERLQTVTEGYRVTMETLAAWFDGRDSQGRRLRRQMRDAIAPMIRGRRTLAAVGGHVSRRTELLGLAGRLQRCADDETAWRLWCIATGLFSASHFTARSPEPAGSPAAHSFWTAEPVPVSVRLRTQGPRALTGRPARIPDRRGARLEARRRAAAELVREAEVVRALLERSGQLLSTWQGLTQAELDAVLDILPAVAAARYGRADEAVVAATGDGRWVVRAEPAGRDSAVAVVATDSGWLVHPDMRLTVLRSSMSVDPGPEVAR